MGKKGKCKVCTFNFETFDDAESVLDELDKTVANYGFATLGDVCELSGILQYPYQNNFVRIRNLGNIKVRKVVTYSIDIPYEFQEE